MTVAVMRLVDPAIEAPVTEDADPHGMPTLQELAAWPATVNVPRAGLAFGLSRSHAYDLASRGEFPARVIKVGGRYRVVTASIIKALSEDP